MSASANLALPFIEGGELLPDVTLNEALRLIDTLVQLAIVDRDLNAPPGSPTEGQRWIVKASPSPTGAWSGHGNQVAAWQDGEWEFSAPKTGWFAYLIDEGALIAWSGTAWVDALALLATLQNLTLLGVGTTADSTNPFSAKLNNALWVAKTVAEGGDGNLRYKMSKESAAKTLSLLFQDNYSGRAEIGLTGDDDFHFKVSADGSTWAEGIKIDRTTGKVSFPVTGGPREVLGANRTYYVRTDGNDANTGLANTSGGAFLTWQGAYDRIASTLDFAGYTVTVQIADGTYTGALNATKTWIGGGTLKFLGNTTTKANVLSSVTGASNIVVSAPLSGTLRFESFKLTNTGATSNGISIVAPGVLLIYDDIDFGAVGQSHLDGTAPGSQIQCVTSSNRNVISGSPGQAHIHTANGCSYYGVAPTYTLTGTPAWGYRFAYADSAATISMPFATFSGSATGARYIATANGVIAGTGGGASYFPGNAAGSTTTGGQYT